MLTHVVLRFFSLQTANFLNHFYHLFIQNEWKNLLKKQLGQNFTRNYTFFLFDFSFASKKVV